MLSPIARSILAVANTLTASASLAEARLALPDLLEKSPGVWSGRLSGRGDEDAVDLQLTFGADGLIEIRTRATVWDPLDTEPVWKGVWSELTYRHGQPAKWRERPTIDGRKWTLRHEVVTVEKRQSMEGGNVMAQVVLVRRFEQPAAKSLATNALTDLFGEEARVCYPVAPPRRVRHPVPAHPAAQPRRAQPVEPRQKPVDYPRIRAGGPYRPEWRHGRQRPAPDLSFGDGPLFFVTTYRANLVDPGPDLKALEIAFDALATRSDWAPFRRTSCAIVRYHSDRWWYLGGGVMLHAFVKEYSGFGESTSTITIDGYHEMDGPPDQCVRPTPDLTQVRQIVRAAFKNARAALV